jgi:hypothetical protein
MKSDDNKYQLGSFISVNGVTIGRIESINLKEAIVRYDENTVETVPLYYIYPINLSDNYMIKLGFSMLRKDKHPNHVENYMTIRVNGKFYNAKGIILKDRSIWSFNNLTIRYIHQVQSAMWIIEPYYNFKNLY